MQVNSLPDIVGDNTAHVIGQVGVTARWVTIGAIGGALRFGDGNVGAARGVNIAQNTAKTIEAESDITAVLDLSLLYVYVPTGSTATISYGR